ncbi:DUF2164 domain-containing protein [Phenylobacterium sp.]|jgi:uncharacterized protein (DUF2164 family)|uniref:DUF2164 domain-containing protein n=1 Tax=Phenylobacterium sp. TaxID=1871053 RepID=UPI002F927DA9
MARIELEKPVRDAMARALTRYLKDELDVEIGGMDAVLLVDFLGETLGPHYYNQGLADAQAILQAKLEQIGDAILEIEKPARL